MNHRLFLGASAVAVMLFVAACNQEAEVLPAPGNGEPINTAGVEMPPMVARSAAYRCDDGQALYISFLTDDSAVNVRDSRADIPARLSRQEGETYSGGGRTLIGTGDEIGYESADRPQQRCRVGAE